MNLYYLIIVYIILSGIVGLEGLRRQIGFIPAFLINILLTPILGYGIIGLFKKNLAISHYVKSLNCFKCIHQLDDFDKHCLKCGTKSNWKKVA